MSNGGAPGLEDGPKNRERQRLCRKGMRVRKSFPRKGRVQLPVELQPARAEPDRVRVSRVRLSCSTAFLETGDGKVAQLSEPNG